MNFSWVKVCFWSLCVACTLGAVPLFGQQYQGTFYKTVDGLENSNVLQMHLDRDGFLWVIGPFSGWVRYFDGERFVQPLAEKERVRYLGFRDGQVILREGKVLWRLTGLTQTLEQIEGVEQLQQMVTLDNGNHLIFHPSGVVHWDGQQAQVFNGDDIFPSDFCLPILSTTNGTNFLYSRCDQAWLVQDGKMQNLDQILQLQPEDAIRGLYFDGVAFWVHVFTAPNSWSTLFRLQGDQSQRFDLDRTYRVSQNEDGETLWLRATGAQPGPWFYCDENGPQAFESSVWPADVNIEAVLHEDGQTWLVGPGHLLRLSDNKLFQNKRLWPTDASSSRWDSMTAADRLWFAWEEQLDDSTRIALVRLDPDGLKFFYLPTIPGAEVKDTFIDWRRPLLQNDEQGFLWVNSPGGFFLWDKGRWQPFHSKNIDHRLRDVDPVVDRHGNIWISAVDGVLRLNLHTMTFGPAQGLEDTTSLMPFLDDAGKLWVVSNNGLSQFNEVFFNLRLEGNDFAPSLVSDEEGALWSLTFSSLQDVNSDKQVTLETIQKYSTAGYNGTIQLMAKDHSGDIWANHGLLRRNGYLIPEMAEVIRLSNQKVQTFDAEDGVPDAPITQVVCDRKGQVWISGDWLAKWNGKRFETGPFKEQMAARRWSTALDPKGTFWLYLDGELYNLTEGDQTGRKLPVAESTPRPEGMIWLQDGSLVLSSTTSLVVVMPDDRTLYLADQPGFEMHRVVGIASDHAGRLWVGTNRGLVVFENERFFDFHHLTNVPQAEVTGILTVDQEGMLWVPTLEGLWRIEPEMALAERDPPRVYMQHMTADGENWSEPPDAALPYKARDITFHFNGLDFTNNRALRYQYRLTPYEKDWQDPQPHNPVRYTNLWPGTYNFEVFAVDGRGNQSQPAQFQVSIAAPFWMQWWFIGAVLLVIGFLIVRINRYFLRRKLKQQAILSEINVARTMQMGLMPLEAPHVGGYEICGTCIPAKEVGGDFFDFMWLENDQRHLGVVVADVSGKAMKAAMVAVLTNGMVATESEMTRDPAVILGSVNRGLKLKSPKQMFTTMVAVALDTHSGSLQLANAGHEPPLLIRDHKVQCLKVDGFRAPLGVLPKANYQPKTLDLQSGDSLVLFSDGLTEAMNTKNELFGLERVNQILAAGDHDSAHSTMQAILGEVQQFRAGAEPSDDLTIVVIKKL